MINEIKRIYFIEILVSTTIMVFLSGLAIQITAEVVKIWGRSSGKLATLSEARIAMDIIANDLEGVVLRNDGTSGLEQKMFS